MLIDGSLVIVRMPMDQAHQESICVEGKRRLFEEGKGCYHSCISLEESLK